MNKPHYEYRIIQKIDADLLPKRVPKRIRTIISSISPDDIVSSASILTKYGQELGEINAHYPKNVISFALHAAYKMNLVERLNDNQIPDWFQNLDTVVYWSSQLRGSRYKNTKDVGTGGTRPVYLYHLWNFNKWIKDRMFKITILEGAGTSIFTQRTTMRKFQTVEEVLRLLDQPMVDPKNVIRIVKQYLLDPTHLHKKATYMSTIKNALQSYFVKNEHEIHIHYNPKNLHSTESEEQSMSLSDLRKFLTVSSVIERAVFLSKFQRGLDASTLVDRFNFVVWDQLVSHFGDLDHTRWDLSKCPVPIRCVRMKTDFKHTGFLDRDAISAIITYLDHRQTKTGRSMSTNQPLFINKFGNPITTTWIFRSFAKLAKESSIQNCTEVDGKRFYKLDSHELRDLLKSTLIDSGCRLDVAEHVIGHKPRDSYEKQSKLYPETMRNEYAKASSRLNLMSTSVSTSDHPLDNDIQNSMQSIQTITNSTKQYTQLQSTHVQKDNFRNIEYADIQSHISNLQNTVFALTKIFNQSMCADCNTIHVNPCPNHSI